MIRFWQVGLAVVAGWMLGCHGDSDEQTPGQAARANGPQEPPAALTTGSPAISLEDTVARLNLADDEFLARLDTAGELLRRARRDLKAQKSLASWLPGDSLSRLAAALDKRAVVMTVDRVQLAPPPAPSGPIVRRIAPATRPAQTRPAGQSPTPEDGSVASAQTQPVSATLTPKMWRFSDDRIPDVFVVGQAEGIIAADELGNGLGDLHYRLRAEPVGPVAVRKGDGGTSANESKSFFLHWEITVAARGLTLDGQRLPDQPQPGFTFRWTAAYRVEAHQPGERDTAGPPSRG